MSDILAPEDVEMDCREVYGSISEKNAREMALKKYRGW